MLSALYKGLRQLLLLTPCVAAIMIAGVSSSRNSPQGSTQSTSDAPIYFPPEQSSTPIFSVILASLSEPSLFEAAKDARVLSFRVSYFSPVPERRITVRLIVNADGSGKTITAVSSGVAAGVKRTQNSVSPENVNKLIQLLAKVEFWSLSSAEDTEQRTDDAGRKQYTFDGSFWMVEGVQKGSFHYVYRVNPKWSPIKEIGCYMAKDLANTSDSAISMPGCTSRSQ